MHDISQLLGAIEQGDAVASEALLPLVYQELRRLAEIHFSNEKPGQTLQATALVHEAYLRLVEDQDHPKAWNGRGHFYAAAAESMRRILVENARRKSCKKRGGDVARVEFLEAEVNVVEVREDLVELDEALTKLEETDPQAAKLVQLRYFGGMTIPEVAVQLEISTRTAERIWNYARTWLHCELTEEESS